MQKWVPTPPLRTLTLLGPQQTDVWDDFADVHQIQLDELPDEIKTGLLVVTRLLTQFYHSDSSVASACDNLQCSIHHRAQF